MERILICGLFAYRLKDSEITVRMTELKNLSISAGGEVCGQSVQKKDPPDRRYLIGKGKANEIQQIIAAQTIDLIIFYNSLTHIQQRNLEDLFQIQVIDRTRLILDIFASRARSMEGKLQVELAQLLYLLPRLTGKGVAMSRLGGGIGTRGPGETKLETDRRVIKKKITTIKRKLQDVIKNRDIQRKHRRTFPVPVISLVGYTSAGKSTLFKTLTAEDVFISKKLFSTLDPILRRVELGHISAGYYFLLSDTVGFIRMMPEELFTSFQATLEEVIQTDLILHVVDLSVPDHHNQRAEVETILERLGVSQNKVLTVFNKIDLLPDHSDLLQAGSENEFFISATENLGIQKLLQAIFETCFRDYRRHLISIPENAFNPDSLQRWAIVVKKNHSPNHTIQLEILCHERHLQDFMEKFGGSIQ